MRHHIDNKDLMQLYLGRYMIVLMEMHEQLYVMNVFLSILDIQ